MSSHRNDQGIKDDSSATNGGVIKTVPVALGDTAYDILIGQQLIGDAGTHIKPHITGTTLVIISDENVAPLHLETLIKGLESLNCHLHTLILPAGEATKSLQHYEKLVHDLLALKLSRRDMLVAFGGGVVGDLVGFAASTYQRGIGFIQIPTTLLSQVDSSVGGKTGINTPFGKNLIGAFYQPKQVLIDLDVLQTLPRREMLAGYAEVVKYGLINDKAFFEWLEGKALSLLAFDGNSLAHAIATCCSAKAAIVAADEKEQGVRALLNLGHTFGHALEAELGYDGRLLHGEAVSIGMVLAFELSESLGLCQEGCAERIKQHLAAVGLPTRISDRLDCWTADTLIDHMGHDKKAQAHRLVFILARGIGDAFIGDCENKSILRSILSPSEGV